MTRYAIKLAAVPMWAGNQRQWFEGPEHAVKFDSMTRATIAAVYVFELGPDEFTVEAVPGN
jgi:hypothetical protein